jgi:myo-inositol 2-dehydrogenase / D-chiro-inositol 1-dehydrogenase
LVAQVVDAEVVANPIVALERADAAAIATSPDTHAEHVKAAVDRRLPVLCEKPLAADLRGAIDVADYVQSTGVPVQVGLQRRFDPAYAAARALVASGSLGRLHLMRLHGTEPTTPRSHRTTLFRNTAIHDFDLIRWLSGTEVESVYVEGSDREQGPFDRGLDPDTIVVTVRLCDGSLGAVTITRLSPHGYDVRAELVGSLDHIVVGWTERTPIRLLEPDAPIVPNAWRTWQARFEEAYRSELEAFLAAARGVTGVAVTVRDGVESQRIAEAVHRTLIKGRKVMLER